MSTVYRNTLLPIGTHLGDHPSRPHVTMGLVQPTRGSKGTSNPPLASELHPCLALLPMADTWPPTLLPAPVVSYTTFSPLPGSEPQVLGTCDPVAPAVIFCGPMRGFARPGVTRHRALWSADFPRVACATRDRPADPQFNRTIPPLLFAVDFPSAMPVTVSRWYGSHVNCALTKSVIEFHWLKFEWPRLPPKLERQSAKGVESTVHCQGRKMR